MNKTKAIKIKNWEEFLEDEPEDRREDTILQIESFWLDKEGNLVLVDDNGNDKRDLFVIEGLQWGFNFKFIELFLRDFI